MNEDKFLERWILEVCVHLYGAPIALRTWQKFKVVCRVPDMRKQQTPDKYIPKTNCLWLMCLCWLKAENRAKWEQVQRNKLQHHDLNWEQKKKILDSIKKGNVAGKQYKVTLKDVIRLLNSPVPLSDGRTRLETLNKALGSSIMANGVLGRDVPEWIKKQTGIEVSVRTLQRKAKAAGLKFSLPNPTPRETLDYFLDVYWNKSKSA